MIDLKAISPRQDAFERLLKAVQHQEQIARFGRPAGGDYSRFARSVEKRIAQQIALLGYTVRPTSNNAPFDLWAGGAKIEVKGSRWNDNRGRYQAAIRNYQADVLLFDAVNGSDHIFIIPMQLIIPKKTIEVCSYDVSQYSGQWAAFLEAWDHLHRAIELAPRRPIQLELGLCLDMTT